MHNDDGFKLYLSLHGCGQNVFLDLFFFLSHFLKNLFIFGIKYDKIRLDIVEKTRIIQIKPLMRLHFQVHINCTCTRTNNIIVPHYNNSIQMCHLIGLDSHVTGVTKHFIILSC